MNFCPCCSSILFRCIQHGKITWFCSRCRQEMPNFSSRTITQTYNNVLTNQDLSIGSIQLGRNKFK
jgi:DNA-directed RNA polymerase subunit M/transcription elongation factor TFIIS